MEKNDFRTELNPFEMLEELLWQDQFELIFQKNQIMKIVVHRKKEKQTERKIKMKA